ncbi:hypothetical protein BGZ52_011604 [Haplosporangium bisporale]|nr:hypothetical protein BGZ52_011604 [Haplosporangium bisporale]KAF9214950.1 hypothetical protein BGZ59_002601 [Podila verticillata]KAI9231479.1 MAG: hypothetical protein BYD32DRAFT_467114 [Podila humilis]KFH68015.1 hypothetical protein MVEG_06745 [Podila verticillata NRRL 6337]
MSLRVLTASALRTTRACAWPSRALTPHTWIPLSSIHPTLITRHSSSSSSPTPAEIIASWKTSVLSKPVIIEHDTIRPTSLRQLAMTLDKSTPPQEQDPLARIGSPLPVNWHHVFFPPMIGECDLGDDGYEMTHAPPAPYLARMWAGGGVEQNPANLLRVGQEMTMKTKCTGVDIKQNRSGDVMVFVSLEKLVENEFGWALTDTRTLVYMEKDEKKKGEGSSPPKLVKPRRQADFSTTVHPSAILLFRYSALTFNSHRIHFDHEYANKVEDHPGCLVHGPLSATYMLENLRQKLASGLVMKNFRYRALSPLIVDRPLKVCAKKMQVIPTMDADVLESYEVWVENSEGGLAMSGTVEVVKEP